MGFQLIKGTKIARLILPQGFHDHDFIKMMKHERHGRNRIRLLAMYHLQLGKSFKAHICNSEVTLENRAIMA